MCSVSILHTLAIWRRGGFTPPQRPWKNTAPSQKVDPALQLGRRQFMTRRVSVTATTSETFSQNHTFIFLKVFYTRGGQDRVLHTQPWKPRVSSWTSLVLKVMHCSFFKTFKRTNTTEKSKMVNLTSFKTQDIRISGSKMEDRCNIVQTTEA